MVDISIVEGHKENIAANANGYRLSDLAEALGAHGAHGDESLGSPARIVSPDDCDPLARVLATLNHCKLSAPFIGLTPALIPAMEECLHRFVSWELYKNDMRYINLWLDYSTFSEAPQRVFEYMEDNRIGWFSALFYDKWANLCETVGNVGAALKVLNRGIGRQAQPLLHLENTRSMLQGRIANAPSVGGLAKKRRRHESAAAVKTTKLKVFHDTDSESEECEEAEEISISNKSSVARVFPYISLEKRENRAPVNPLDGQVFAQAPRGAPPAGPSGRLLVFQDDESTGEVEQMPTDTLAPDWLQLKHKSHKLMLVAMRRFSAPVRDFNHAVQPLCVKRLVNGDNATKLIGDIEPALANVLYAQHAGHTEPLLDCFGAGPATEQLGQG